MNTHFSFPMLLDMTPYMEHTLIPNKTDKEAAEVNIRQVHQLKGIYYDYFFYKYKLRDLSMPLYICAKALFYKEKPSYQGKDMKKSLK